MDEILLWLEIKLSPNIASVVAYIIFQLSGPYFKLWKEQWISGILHFNIHISYDRCVKSINNLYSLKIILNAPCCHWFSSNRLAQRILQFPDVLLYGFQALWDSGGRLVCRHTWYWNLWDRASEHLHYHNTIPIFIAAGECSIVWPLCSSVLYN